MAQSRKPSARHTEDWVIDDCPYNDFWSDSDLSRRRRECILEVGGPRLFEKPQSGVRKMPRSLDPTDRTSDDDDCCDSGAYSANGDCSGLSDNDDSAYYPDDARCRPTRADADQCDSNAQYHDDVCYFNYTDDARYQPNGLRRKKSCSQQEQPRASRTRTKRGYTEGVGSARRPGNDWEGIRGLGNDLFFEILRLVLVFSLIFARIGTALGEEIGDDICQWLEKRALENRHKRGWVAIEDSKEQNLEGGQNTRLQNTHPCIKSYTLADICSHTEAH